MKKINFKFDINIKKVFFFISFIFFIYLLYLSIPSLYETGRVQKDISEKLDRDFNLKFSLSTDISYRILPKPHFIIKDCELIELESNISNRVAEVQSLKVFVEQSNFFSKEINIKHLNISNANFFIDKSKFNFIKIFLNNKFSKKKIKVNKSKIFFKDKNDELVFIYTIRDLNTNYEKDKNVLNLNGEIFNLNNQISWSKNFKTNKKITKIKSKKIFLNFKNESSFEENKPRYENILELQSNKFKTNYEPGENNISFFSKKSLIKNTLINYEGNLELDPFNFNIDINSKKINLNYFFKNLNLLNEILLSKLLFKKSLYGEIKINSDNIVNSKVFNAAKITINFQGGSINLDNSVFLSNNLGSLKVFDSKFILNNNSNSLIFEGMSKLDIKDLNFFYKMIQTPKKNRIKLSSIDFLFEINPKNGIFKIKKAFLYDEKKKLINSNSDDDEVNIEFSYLNSILFKNFVNDLLINNFYEG